MLDDPRRHIAEIKAELPRYESKIHQGDVVLDLGANVGIVAEYAAKRASRVIAVEASVRHYDLLLSRCRTLPNVTCVHAAIWTHDGTVAFTEDQSNYTMDRVRYDSLDDPSCQVPCITLPSLFKWQGIDHVDFLKMDVEGAELDILSHESFAEVAPMIDSMWVEVHNYKDWCACDDAYRRVEAAAKRFFPNISQNTWGWFYAKR